MPRDIMGFKTLSDIFKLAQSRYPNFGKRLHEAEALNRWEAAVGPVIAKHSRAIRVQDGVLWVEVDHPIWKSELHHRKRQILNILNGGREESLKQGIPLPPAKEILADLLFLDPQTGYRNFNPK